MIGMYYSVVGNQRQRQYTWNCILRWCQPRPAITVFALAPINVQTVNFLELWRKSLCSVIDMNSDFPLHVWKGELTIVACGCAIRK